MRPAGGFTPDMLNFSQSVDVYQIWADMVAFDRRRHTYEGEQHYCAYIGRRDGVQYSLSDQALMECYGEHVCLHTRMPAALSGAMGNQVTIACFDTEAEVKEFMQTAFA